MASAITEKSQTVLNTIAKGVGTREAIAEKLGVTVPVVNGSLTALKRNGLIEIDDDGYITVTEDAAEFVSTKPRAARAAAGEHRAGTKMAEAAKIFEKKFSNGRQAVLNAFMTQVGLTKAGASTYYQMLRSQAGMTHGVAFQKRGGAARGRRTQ